MKRWRVGTLDQLPEVPKPLPPVVTEKSCPACLQVLPLEAFARNRQSSTGRASYCKPCAKTKYHEPARAKKRLVARPTEGDQVCDGCNLVLPVGDFYWKADQGRFANKCKTCKSAEGKANWDPVRGRDNALRKKYGITALEFDLLLATQAGGCAICEITVNSDARALAVDHCHKTGKVRGILCGRCNKAIGLFRDDPLLLAKGVAYLKAG